MHKGGLFSLPVFRLEYHDLEITVCGYPTVAPTHDMEAKPMSDLAFVALTCLFFAGTWGLVVLYGRLRGE